MNMNCYRYLQHSKRVALAETACIVNSGFIDFTSSVSRNGIVLTAAGDINISVSRSYVENASSPFRKNSAFYLWCNTTISRVCMSKIVTASHSVLNNECVGTFNNLNYFTFFNCDCNAYDNSENMVTFTRNSGRISSLNGTHIDVQDHGSLLRMTPVQYEVSYVAGFVHSTETPIVIMNSEALLKVHHINLIGNACNTYLVSGGRNILYVSDSVFRGNTGAGCSKFLYTIVEKSLFDLPESSFDPSAIAEDNKFGIASSPLMFDDKHLLIVKCTMPTLLFTRIFRTRTTILFAVNLILT